MPDIYEFHVGGLIGPVVRSALPELTSIDDGRQTRLFGTAVEPSDVDRLLVRLAGNGLVPNHIVLSNRSRWDDESAAEHLPVTQGGPEAADDYAFGADDSAPRQS